VQQPADENTAQRSRRQLMELLQELRVALPGVQVLFGFLLVVPFSARWAEVNSFQRDLYFACLLCAAGASAFLIAPTAIHRLDFDRGDKPLIVQISNVLAIVGLTFLALAIVGVVLLITDVLYDGASVAGYTAGVAAMFVALWYTIPLLLRLRK
jgi:FtsH-binding integral membrane protein